MMSIWLGAPSKLASQAPSSEVQVRSQTGYTIICQKTRCTVYIADLLMNGVRFNNIYYHKT